MDPKVNDYESRRNDLIKRAAAWTDANVPPASVDEGPAGFSRFAAEWNRLYSRRMDELAFVHGLVADPPRPDRYRDDEIDPFALLRSAERAREKAEDKARKVRAECMRAAA